ncbi:hypothetical protein SeMB42_g07328 [Synchytrium endobioticum]|uniref:Uncharacterized protein n=1 Tax=Synchytrium endobioticum TaxID=286115 RepID=A0A507C5P7_9FUNG|nr:hypothetical protein SeMB42_g07328 [Synchytrium endobioticum]
MKWLSSSSQVAEQNRGLGKQFIKQDPSLQDISFDPHDEVHNSNCRSTGRANGSYFTIHHSILRLYRQVPQMVSNAFKSKHGNNGNVAYSIAADVANPAPGQQVMLTVSGGVVNGLLMGAQDGTGAFVPGLAVPAMGSFKMCTSGGKGNNMAISHASAANGIQNLQVPYTIPAAANGPITISMLAVSANLGSPWGRTTMTLNVAAAPAPPPATNATKPAAAVSPVSATKVGAAKAAATKPPLAAKATNAANGKAAAKATNAANGKAAAKATNAANGKAAAKAAPTLGAKQQKQQQKQQEQQQKQQQQKQQKQQNAANAANADKAGNAADNLKAKVEAKEAEVKAEIQNDLANL